MKIFFYILVVMCLTACCNSKQILITQFYPFKVSADSPTRKDDFFLVTNYSDNKKALEQIDSFVSKHIDPDYLKLGYYCMNFFKESGKTNLQAIERNPRVVDRYSFGHDLIFTYTWEYGKYSGRRKIIKGEDVEYNRTKLKFTIERLPDSTRKN